MCIFILIRKIIGEDIILTIRGLGYKYNGKDKDKEI